ncbi:helix-turn-helix transcriptional regulator [Mycobacterium asiaticum]|uniref:Helix-turn-helix transcriptional regulator n=1 Tax=Mycobacterium asiaticum TaxID=1790 RepID=A0A1A3P9J3_MYCAS|nr:isoniazid response ATPase/transcriptional regulator IniR [Mycobacterium asiaticum]OBK30360.1 helix-turn-helix transcriptional regulator [Mycobacterium asiaticum]
MPDLLTDFPRGGRAVVADLAKAATVPVKALITGGIGTGKSTLLVAARETARRADITVLPRPARDADPPDAALIVDDAHLLTDGELARLTERVADARATVVIATEAHEQRPALRSLMTAIERERPRISLGPRPVAEQLLDCTAGLPFLVHAEGAQPNAARLALIERLRRSDEPALDALLIMTLAHELGPADIAAALGISAAEARTLADQAHASGLVEPSHPPAFRQLVHDAVAQLVGNAHHREVETSLLRSQLDISTVTPELALRLAEHGLYDDRLAAILARQAAENRSNAAQAARVYAAAVRAGATGLNAHLADALARTGDCARAAVLADELLESSDSTERAAAVRISASIAAHDGNTEQAAQLFSWLGPYPDAVVGSAAAIVLSAAGDLAAAQAAMRLKDSGPPTLAARASRSLSEGLLLTMDQPYPTAMAKLSQAIATNQSIGVAFPDSPAALVTLAAIHAGDPVRAHSVVGRAVRDGGDALFGPRHQLLSGWIKMQDGQLPSAGADVAALATIAASDLYRRDALWAAALQTAIARRSGDTGALHKCWYAAMEVLAEYSVDLFALLPLGELWVAAARMRQVHQLQHTLDQAFTLLNSLGNPPLWSNALHWAGVHAAILANSPESVAPHGQALGAAAAHSSLAQALSGAGRTWLRVLADQVDAAEVTAAARSLSNVGLTSDATRLAGQAALQTPDAKVSGAMLQLARDLKVGTGFGEVPAGETPSEPSAPATRQPRSGSPLSDREREVAELLLLGLPYRDIGGQLFISAKTVEHHVARIRRHSEGQQRVRGAFAA